MWANGERPDRVGFRVETKWEEKGCGVSGETYAGFVKSPDASAYDRCEAVGAWTAPFLAEHPEAERELAARPVTLGDSGKLARLRAGATLLLALEEKAARGYRWEVEQLAGDAAGQPVHLVPEIAVAAHVGARGHRDPAVARAPGHERAAR